MGYGGRKLDGVPEANTAEDLHKEKEQCSIEISGRPETPHATGKKATSAGEREPPIKGKGGTSRAKNNGAASVLKKGARVWGGGRNRSRWGRGRRYRGGEGAAGAVESSGWRVRKKGACKKAQGVKRIHGGYTEKTDPKDNGESRVGRGVRGGRRDGREARRERGGGGNWFNEKNDDRRRGANGGAGAEPGGGLAAGRDMLPSGGGCRKVTVPRLEKYARRHEGAGVPKRKHLNPGAALSAAPEGGTERLEEPSKRGEAPPGTATDTANSTSRKSTAHHHVLCGEAIIAV